MQSVLLVFKKGLTNFLEKRDQSAVGSHEVFGLSERGRVLHIVQKIVQSLSSSLISRFLLSNNLLAFYV